MNRTGHTALAASAFALGGALIARQMRGRRRMEVRDRVAVITGGSRGLGLLIARQLAGEGAIVTIAARDEAELARAAEDLRARGAHVHVVVCDVGVREQAEGLIRDTVARHGRIDLLVNNAGVMKVGPVEHMEHADFEEAMAVHFWGPLHTIQAAVPVMRRQGGGRVVNISSIGGRIAVPHLTPYCASKFALTGLSDALRNELAKDGILVTTVCPGLMRTGSPFNAWFKGRYRDEFAWFAIADSLPVGSIDGRRAAWQIVEAARHGDAELVITLPAKLAIIANALAPELVALAMSTINATLLPPPQDDRGAEGHSGWQSASRWAPSTLTRLTERAARENNELPSSSGG
ncbi:MAG TPA: SDR family oxidoreductase [Vicinamibacterales bacterium]|nr:SDR family oxidoreductase [Vicinamibacterales bacterium]